MTLALDRALAQISELGRWRAVSNGGHWYVVTNHKPMRVLSDRRGLYLRFGSFETAHARAEEENKCQA